jgi:hypothetical protein
VERNLGAAMRRTANRGTGGRYGRTPQVMPRKREWNDFVPLNKITLIKSFSSKQLYFIETE